MRKLIFSINVSLDGFADHTVAIADDELHDFFAAQLDTLDMVLFGRVTYQLFESYWPYAPEEPEATKGVMAFANKINAIPKIVFSSTLQNVNWNNTRLIQEDMVQAVTRLKQEDGKGLSIGGLKVIQTFMKLKLVDEFWLLVHPVIVGSGRPLFEGVNEKLTFELAATKTFHSGVVVLHYLVNRK